MAATSSVGDTPKPTASKWKVWHTLGILGIITGAVLSFFLLPLAFRLWVWLGSMFVLALLAVVISHGVTGYWRGLLIDQRNRISLSRLQASLWTLSTTSSFLSAALFNVRHGQADPLLISIPPGIWALMGISATSLIGTPLIQNYKQNQDAQDEETAQTMNQLSAQNVDVNQLAPKGLLLTNKSPANAKWTDLFRGEEVGNAAQIDLGKIQLIYFTLILVFVYTISLGALFASQASVINTFPNLNEGILTLLGISNGAYLTNKAVPHSSTS
jgi:Ca2+/Na+ antiporter